MTVVVLAQGSDSVVIAADGRTRYADSSVYDDARKVRVHRTGRGGVVTASSGRATITPGRTIGDIECQFFEDTDAEEPNQLGPLLVSYLSKAIADANIAEACTCAKNFGECVQPDFCAGCTEDVYSFVPNPDCEQCHGVPDYRWIDDEHCPCSPGESAPASTPSVYAGSGDWCRCSAFTAKPLALLYVPFGPVFSNGYGLPVTTVIGPDHRLPTTRTPLAESFSVHGELTSQHAYDLTVVSDTVALAKMYSAAEKVPLTQTQDRARTLIRSAFSEASASALLRTDTYSKFDSKTLGLSCGQSISLNDLAELISKTEAIRNSSDPLEYRPTIGGIATWSTVDRLGNATEASPMNL